MEEALVGAAQGLQVTLGGDRVTILLADPEKRVLRVRAYAGYSEEISRLEVPFGQGITGWVAEHQQLLRVNDVTQDPRYLQVSSDVRSELAIPLVYRGELLGVLNVESEQLGAYDESDEEMLGTLAGSLAAIIANARLLDQVRRQVERERLIYELTTRIRRATNMQGVMATTVSELSKVLGARRARIRVGVGEGESPGANGEDASVSGGPS
jgi:GAF domain-containing protein